MKSRHRMRQACRLVGGLTICVLFCNAISVLWDSDLQAPPTQSHELPLLDSYGKTNSSNQAKFDGFWRDKERLNSKGMKLVPPRFLLGIMSHKPSNPGPRRREFDRRQMIRTTYLSYYKDHGTTEEVHRICGIHELVSGRVSVADCQIAYTFVMGQSTDPPADNRTELLHAKTTRDMIRPHQEDDVLSLDIAENGKFGKSPTWFRYASLLVKERSDLQQFQYVIKTDSDTLLIPPRFLRWIDEQEESIDYQRTHIYGGTPLDKVACGWPNHDHCNNMTAPYFHGGGFYFVTMDVSEYIVSDQCPRSELFVPHEDVTMGNYVHSMTTTRGIPIIAFRNQNAYHDTWKHPIKDSKRMYSLWKAYVVKKKKRMKNRGNMPKMPI